LTRRRALIGLAIVVVALMVVIGLLDQRMRDSGGPGIIGFEFAGSEERASEILADWGDRGRDAARASLWIDYPYLLALDGHGGDLAPLLAAVCAGLKFALLALVIAYLLAGLLLRLRDRRSARSASA
jgi:hypothetical protein